MLKTTKTDRFQIFQVSVSPFPYIAEKLRKMWEEEEEEKRKQTVPYAEPKSEYFWKTATNHIIIGAETHGLLEQWVFVSAE